jgi:hypothetical protein
MTHASTASPGALESPAFPCSPDSCAVCVRRFVCAATNFWVVRSGREPVTRRDDFAVPSTAAPGRQPRFPLAAHSRRWKAGLLSRKSAYGRRRELTLSATFSHPWSRDGARLKVRNTPKSDEPELVSIVGARGAKKATARWPQRARQRRDANPCVDGGNKALAHANAIMQPVRSCNTVPEREVATDKLNRPDPHVLYGARCRSRQTA